MPLEHHVRLEGIDDRRHRRRQERARARAQWRAGEPHPCGLVHRSGADGWSPLAALLWWMLRSNPKR